MRASTIDWIQHGNMPINSVDVQPRGYRVLTGGGDNSICVWNLLPILNPKFEVLSDPDSTKSGSKPGGGASEMGGSNSRAPVSGKKQREDGTGGKEPDSASNLGNHCDADSPPPVPEDYAHDLKTMEALFDKEEAKSIRKLAELKNHEQPVNCVRWNSIGTFFASAGDDGRAILWEFKGYKHVSRSQEAFNSATSGPAYVTEEDFKNQDANLNEAEVVEIREDWQAKKIWSNHQSIIDLTWAPDSLHFATCGHDAKICIMNINEGAPLTILDSKANGLTFDPFGKFLASQSSEDKSVKIWRVQNFKNITLEKEVQQFYKKAMGMSINRRLSWSSEGSFICSTAGRVCNEQMAPLISRSSWDLMACLAGHNSSINISRVNPSLYKSKGDPLNCYSVVAIGSQDSTISIWKPYLQKPFALVMDFCMMGVTDMSWGFNGNLLLSSTHDGKVTLLHFKPGTLGEPLTEFEKKQIISNKYGSYVLQEYIKNSSTTSQQKSDMTQLQDNQQQNLRHEQKTIVAKNGKKKIQPKIERIFSDSSAVVNPHLNPFMQLGDGSQKNSNSNPEPPKLSGAVAPSQPSQQPTAQTSGASTAPAKIETKPIVAAPLAPKPIAQPVLNSFTQAQSAFAQASGQPVQALSSLQPNNLAQQSAPKSPLASALQEDLSRKMVSGVFGEKDGQINISKMLHNQLSVAVPKQSSDNQQAPVQASSGSASEALQFNNELLQTLKSIYDTNQQYTVISIQEYRSIFTQLLRDEIQIVLPKEPSDLFSEELTILINNIKMSETSQKFELKVYNSESALLAEELVMPGERVLLISANRNFFALYTNKQNLHLFSAASCDLIKKDLFIEGVCMMVSNQETNQLALLSIKGSIFVYEVENPQYPGHTSFKLKNQANFTQILQREFAQGAKEKAKQEGEEAKAPSLDQMVWVRSFNLLQEGKIEIELTNGAIYEYDFVNIKAWKKKAQSHAIALSGPGRVVVNPNLGKYEGLSNGSKDKPGKNSFPLSTQEDLSKLINVLDATCFDDVPSKEIRELRMLKPSGNSQAAEKQELMHFYEHMGLRNEFIKTVREFTMMILEAGDLNKIKTLFMKFDLLHGNLRPKNRFVLNQSQTVNMMLGYLDSTQWSKSNLNPDEFSKLQAKKKQREQISFNKEKLFCGADREQIFRKAILPVIMTVCDTESQTIIQYLQSLMGRLDKFIKEVDHPSEPGTGEDSEMQSPTRAKGQLKPVEFTPSEMSLIQELKANGHPLPEDPVQLKQLAGQYQAKQLQQPRPTLPSTATFDQAMALIQQVLTTSTNQAEMQDLVNDFFFKFGEQLNATLKKNVESQFQVWVNSNPKIRK